MQKITYYEADENDPWHYIWIGFYSDSDAEKIFREPVIKRPQFGRIFDSMLECKNLENGKSAFLSSKLWELSSAILENSAPSAGHIDNALNMIHSEYANSLTVGAIAERLCLDRTYFSALFKKTVGKSPIEYLSEYRLKKAAYEVRHEENGSEKGAARQAARQRKGDREGGYVDNRNRNGRKKQSKAEGI